LDIDHLQEACGLGSDTSPAKATKRKAEAQPVDEEALAALDIEASKRWLGQHESIYYSLFPFERSPVDEEALAVLDIEASCRIF